MTTQQTEDTIINRLIAELEAHPEVREPLLRALLTEDFLRVPVELRALNERQERMEERQERMEQRQERMEERQDRMEQRQDRMEQRQDRMEQRQERMEQDIGELKGFHTKAAAEGAARRIARMVNCRMTAILNSDEVEDLAPPQSRAGISHGDFESFLNADLILEAAHRETGEPHYVAVEASAAGQQKDADRAVRNAAFLTRFTGRPAHALVAAIRDQDGLIPQAAEGKFTWYQISPGEVPTG